LKMDDLLVVSESKHEKIYRKKFNYSAIVILLYGYFENFIERIAKQYVKEIAGLAESFEQLPERIRKNHFSKSIELSQKLSLDKYKGLTTQDQIIANLFSCQNIQSKNFTLNVESYSMHTANVRCEIIDAVFTDVGVEKINQKIIDEPNFSKYLRDNDVEFRALPESEVKFLRGATLKLQERLKELAQRRNEIAHGVQVDNILSTEILQTEYINFLRQYAQSLNQVLQASISSFQKILLADELKNYICIGSPVKVWQKGYIAGFPDVSNDITSRITVGDQVIIEISKKRSKEYKKIKIMQIYVNETPQEYIELSTLPLSFTLKLNEKIKENHVVFVKK